MTRTIIQLYRGTTAQNDAFTGAAGELSFDTTLNQVRVHDGSTQGGHIISGKHPDLFDWKWADHELNDANWLRADTFSWQSGSFYKVAFNELFNDIYISTSWYASGHANVYTKSPTPAAGDTVYSDSACTTSVGTVTSYDELGNSIVYSGTTYTYNSNTYVTPTSETVEGYTVSVYTGHSGRKITIPSYETAVSNIYTATGIAWYYIIDVPNKRFKLPRTKHNKYKALLPVSTANSDTITTSNYPGMLIGGASGASGFQTNPHMLVMAGSARDVAQDYATTNVVSNSAWLPSNLKADTEQDTDQYKYLYFYVGNFTQTALENTAGLNASLFNGKADTDFGNTSMIDYVIEKQDPTALNGYTWYRKYQSGWVEQGGRVSGSNTAATINFPIAMADGNYYINGHVYGNTDQNTNWIKFGTRNTTGTTYVTGYGANNLWALTTVWEVKGKAA